MPKRRLNDATPAEWDRAASVLERDYDVPHDDYTMSIESKHMRNDDWLTFGDITAGQNITFTVTDDFNPRIDYKFREDQLIEEFRLYIDSTYSGHYGQGGLQSSEVIIDRGHGMGFFSGNVDKYNGRYGKKGETPADHRKDIMKIIHYGFLMLYEHDRIHGNNSN